MIPIELFNYPTNAAAQTAWASLGDNIWAKTMTAEWSGTTHSNERMIISAASISDSASKIKIRLKAHSAHDLVIIGASIGERDGNTGNFLGTPTRITFSGNNGVTVPKGTELDSDEMLFPVNKIKDYLSHLFIGNNDSAAGITYGTGDGRYYTLGINSDETMVADISALGYSLGGESICLTAIQSISIQVSSEEIIKKEGDYSMKVAAPATTSLNKSLTKTLTPPFNLTGQDSIKFWAGALRLGTNFKIGFHDSGGTLIEVTPDILKAVYEKIVPITNGAWDGTYLVLGGVPQFTTNMADIIGNDCPIVGRITDDPYYASVIGACLYFPVSIPEGATITSAKIQLCAIGGDPIFKTKIFAEKTNTPSAWSDLANYTSRRANPTTASVAWDEPTISQNDWNDTPSLVNIVQEVADLGAVTGLALFLDDLENRSDDGSTLSFSGYAYDPDKAAKLVITYKIGDDDGLQEVVVDLSLVDDANKDEFDSLILTITNADEDNQIILDCLRAFSDGEYSAEDIEAAEAAQLATDVAAVLAKAAYIDNTQTILGQAGTLNMALYLLKSLLPDEKYLYHDIDRGDGQLGTLRASNIHTSAGAPGVDLASSNLKKDVVVDDITGTMEEGVAGDFPSVSSVLNTDTVNGMPGNVRLPLITEVKKDVAFGPSSSLKGTLGDVSIGDGSVIGNALSDIFNNSPDSCDAVYTPLGGSGFGLRVIIERNVLLQPAGTDAQVYAQGTTIEAILADLGEEPKRGDTFAIGTEIFTVQSIAENDGDTVKAVVT